MHVLRSVYVRCKFCKFYSGLFLPTKHYIEEDTFRFQVSPAEKSKNIKTATNTINVIIDLPFGLTHGVMLHLCILL